MTAGQYTRDGMRRVGPYCVRCRAFMPVEKLTPLKGRRKVSPEREMVLGQPVGRHFCGQPCMYVMEDRP